MEVVCGECAEEDMYSHGGKGIKFKKNVKGLLYILKSFHFKSRQD